MSIFPSQSNSVEPLSWLDEPSFVPNKRRLKTLSSFLNEDQTGSRPPKVSKSDPNEQKPSNQPQKAARIVKSGSQDYHTGNQQQSIKKNFVKGSEDEEEFEIITKKVKVSSDTETKASSLSICSNELEDEARSNFSLKSHEEERRQQNGDNFNVNSLSKQEKNNKNSNSSNKDQQGFKIDLKRCISLNVFQVESRGQEIFFQIEYTEEVTNAKKKVILTRKQMLESNPKIALYFYENHLYFKEDPSFQAEFMKRV